MDKLEASTAPEEEEKQREVVKDLARSARCVTHVLPGMVVFHSSAFRPAKVPVRHTARPECFKWNSLPKAMCSDVAIQTLCVSGLSLQSRIWLFTSTCGRQTGARQYINGRSLGACLLLEIGDHKHLSKRAVCMGRQVAT